MRPLLCILPFLALATAARAATPVIPGSSVFAAYDAPAGDEFSATSSHPDLVVSSLLAGASTAAIEPGVAVPSSIYLATTAASPTAADAVAGGQYIQFTVTPLPGIVMMLGQLQFDAAGGGAAGPRGWALTTSLDGFASILASEAISASPKTFSTFEVALPAGSPIDTAVVFRIHAFAPSAGSGIFLDSISLTGTLVPEPSATALILLASFGALRRRR